MSGLNTQTRLYGREETQSRGEGLYRDVMATVAGKKYHFIGAGGIGMSGLAKVLLNNKAIVTGSDQESSAVTEMLCRSGADIKIGHKGGNVAADAEAVVISAAIREDNPELALSLERGQKIYKYAQMLGEIMDLYEGIAICGTHGKSTTTGWLAYIMKLAGMDPNFIIGAEVSQLGTSSGVGDGRYFVAEACEYDRSFLNLRPRIACVLNIEQDHLDYYKDEQEIVAAFGDFVAGVRPGGTVIANGCDANVAKALQRMPEGAECETFGFDRSCDFSAQNISVEDGFYSFDVVHKGQLLGRTRISLPGKHNILNALAVTALAVSAGMADKVILELLPEFKGMDRRLMFKGCISGITVLDDYAHHPTEIRASLQAIRQRYEPKRIFCVFQPHQYSRTRFLLDDFAESFKLADVTIVPEIYFVRDTEESKRQVNARVLVERIESNGSRAVFIDGFAQICEYLREKVTAGDLVVTMGAGTIWKVADEYIQWLGRNR